MKTVTMVKGSAPEHLAEAPMADPVSASTDSQLVERRGERYGD